MDNDLENKSVEKFNSCFDSLELHEEQYTKAIEMLATVIHSKKVQSIVNDMYLEHKGYDLQALEERGQEFLSNAVKKAKAREGDQKQQRADSDFIKRTAEHIKNIVHKGNEEKINILARIIVDKDKAKSILRKKGYGWSGLSLLETVKWEVPNKYKPYS